MLVEPGEGGRDARVLVAQPVHELDRQRIGKRRLLKGGKHGRDTFGGDAARPEQPVRQPVRRPPQGAILYDQPGEAPQILDQDDAQRDGHRPQFADGERLHLLIGVQEARQHVGIEAAVGVGHEGPCHAEDARISGKRPGGELGKLAVIAGRKVGADLADLLLDQMIIVDQPFRGGGDGAALVNGAGDGAIGRQQGRAVFGEPAGQGMAAHMLRGHRLRPREAAGMLFQPIDTEEFVADRLAVAPQRGRTAPPAGVHEEGNQVGLSAPLGAGARRRNCRPQATEAGDHATHRRRRDTETGAPGGRRRRASKTERPLARAAGCKYP